MLGTLVRPDERREPTGESRHEESFDRRRDRDCSRHHGHCTGNGGAGSLQHGSGDERWGWGGWLAAGVIGGIALGALTSPYYYGGYGYGGYGYGYGYPAYSYPYGYAGYYGYSPYTYGYAPSYGYSYAYAPRAYAPRYYRVRRYH